MPWQLGWGSRPARPGTPLRRDSSSTGPGGRAGRPGAKAPLAARGHKVGHRKPKRRHAEVVLAEAQFHSRAPSAEPSSARAGGQSRRGNFKSCARTASVTLWHRGAPAGSELAARHRAGTRRARQSTAATAHTASRFQPENGLTYVALSEPLERYCRHSARADASLPRLPTPYKL